jgi:Uri superfamily endonuclease
MHVLVEAMNPSLPSITILGTEFQCGSYVLRIRLEEALTLRFGRFKKGKAITMSAGEYVYVGSALSTRGATSLASRLVRHATRSGDKPPHRIRGEMLEHFRTIGLGKENPTPKHGKKTHWHVDYLLDELSAEIVNVFAIRSDRKLEAALGKFLENHPHTVVFEKGLGANDVSGNTHILRVGADETWWHDLVDRLRVLKV